MTQRLLSLPHEANLAHAHPAATVLEALEGSEGGLAPEEARARLARSGPNALSRAQPPAIWRVLLRQFRSPLLYVLLAAAVLSLLFQEWSEAGFIFAVLLINAVVGAYQEHSAERSAQALQGLLSLRARAVRGGEDCEVDADELVPGDVVVLEPGTRVPANLRLLDAHSLAVDESRLTGESVPVARTVALGVGMARMARRNVIVRRLVAVESLGSCTCIASDKTGTLTLNRLTVRPVVAQQRHGAGDVPGPLRG